VNDPRSARRPWTIDRSRSTLDERHRDIFQVSLVTGIINVVHFRTLSSTLSRQQSLAIDAKGSSIPRRAIPKERKSSKGPYRSFECSRIKLLLVLLVVTQEIFLLKRVKAAVGFVSDKRHNYKFHSRV